MPDFDRIISESLRFWIAANIMRRLSYSLIAFVGALVSSQYDNQKKGDAHFQVHEGNDLRNMYKLGPSTPLESWRSAWSPEHGNVDSKGEAEAKIECTECESNRREGSLSYYCHMHYTRREPVLWRMQESIMVSDD